MRVDNRPPAVPCAKLPRGGAGWVPTGRTGRKPQYGHVPNGLRRHAGCLPGGTGGAGGPPVTLPVILLGTPPVNRPVPRSGRGPYVPKSRKAVPVTKRRQVRG
jgi:hypothetical protein